MEMAKMAVEQDVVSHAIDLSLKALLEMNAPA